jgi:hypothetical protein
MFHKLSAAGLLCCTAAFADFSYEQTSRITGGAMAGMMKMAGAFSKAARDPMQSRVMLKGDRMATVSGSHINVIDLNAGTFTDIDLEKKQYSTVTFDEMKRAMEKLAERLQSKQQPAASGASFKAEVKETGATKIVSGMNAKQVLLTLAMEGTDKQTGGTGEFKMVNEMWMAPTVPGYEEVRAFYARMAEKMDWSPFGNMARALTAQQPGASKGMSELVKEMSKIDGIPVMQVTRVGATGQGGPADAQTGSAPAAAHEAPQAESPDAKQAAGQAAASAALGRSKLGGLAGGLSGFGGFGRKKKQQPAEQAPEQAPAPAAQPAAASNSGSASLMEITTELSAFSSAAVDGSALDVPSGFKKVEHEMTKMANK